MSNNAKLPPKNPIDAERRRAREAIEKGGPMAAFWSNVEYWDQWLAAREEPEKPIKWPGWLRRSRFEPQAVIDARNAAKAAAAAAAQVPAPPADEDGHDHDE
jgi:hypothetical protein